VTNGALDEKTLRKQYDSMTNKKEEKRKRRKKGVVQKLTPVVIGFNC